MPRNSTRKSRSRKPSPDRPKKPYPTFPLSPHPSGKWQKKIRGHIHYFGKWAKRVNGQLLRVEGDGWKEALEAYKAQADDLHAGRTPRVKTGGLTVADLCNRFLTAKQRQYEAGEITARMFEPAVPPAKPKGEYPKTTDRLVATFGGSRLVDDLAAEDFEALRAALATQYGPIRLGNEIQKVRSVFKYAYESGLIDKPVRYGPQFKKPSTSVLRRHRAKSGENMLEADQLLALIKAAGVPLRAMILLGLNCGFGNHDVATLPITAVDLEKGWIDYPRPKTGIARRCPLWPETVGSLRDAIAARPEPRHEEVAATLFLTVRGRAWLVNGIANPVSMAARTLMKSVGIHRQGIGFYTLRHVFRTVADAARDSVATDVIMGHCDSSMAAHYRERIDDQRLLAVSDCVRKWLFGDRSESPNRTGVARRNTVTIAKNRKPAPLSETRPMLRLFVG
jgi:integrase